MSLSLSLTGNLSLTRRGAAFVTPTAGAGVSITDIGGGAYRITKTAATGAWNAYARSVDPIAGEFVLRLDAWTAAEGSAGVAQDFSPTDYFNVEYGWYLQVSNQTYFNEGGTLTGLGSAAPPAWLIRDGSNNIKYIRSAATYAAALAATPDRTVAGVTGAMYLFVPLHSGASCTADLAFGPPGAFA